MSRIPILVLCVVALSAIFLVVGCAGGGSEGGQGHTHPSANVNQATSHSSQNAPPPKGTKSFEDLGRRHVERQVHYAQTPPVGGNHNPLWQNCGFYSEPVHNEHAVHSMEHGAIWITYRPDLPQDQIDKLGHLAQSQTYILVSPYPGLPSPVVASAWGRQLRLNSAEDPRLEQFVSAYRLGPQTPEPGAPCTGGTSATASEPLVSDRA